MAYRWMDRLDLPDEPGPLQPLMEIIGWNRVLLEHHCGVTEYTTERICVKVRYGSVRICGKDLSLRRMTKDQLIICGCIEELYLERVGK